MSTACSTQRLSRAARVNSEFVKPPLEDHANLPERILQFGTGAFLRGFADVFIDEANRQEIFAGRAVLVGSTGSGRTRVINEQEGLYTVCIKGVKDGEIVDRCSIVGSVSRAISAVTHWQDVVDLVCSPELEFVISNTTEVGIRFDSSDSPDLHPPRSFPGKLAVLLYDRAVTFNYDLERGLIILCCELIERNGETLREHVLHLADKWKLDARFSDWVRQACRFCNTLVDRIVPGAPVRRLELEERLGYRDELAVQAEPYALWAIEGDDALRAALPFSAADDAIVITRNIAPFRERKVRILNGAHSILVPLAFLCGQDTVRGAMEDEYVGRFVRGVMHQEIVPSMDIDPRDAKRFARQVLDRFANPFFDHELLSIALQQTSKMNVRVLPSIHAYFEKRGELPPHLVLGFAAYLAFVLGKGRAAQVNLPADAKAATLLNHRSKHSDNHAFMESVAADPSIWNRPPAALPGFAIAAADWFNVILEEGTRNALAGLPDTTNGRGTL